MLSFYAIIIGLNNAAISRLRLTWEVRGLWGALDHPPWLLLGSPPPWCSWPPPGLSCRSSRGNSRTCFGSSRI